MLEPELTFSFVQRPAGRGGSVLPPSLLDAIAKTVTSGQAVRIDTATWTATRSKHVYRALHAWSKTQSYTLVRRRTPGEMFVWGVRK